MSCAGVLIALCLTLVISTNDFLVCDRTAKTSFLRMLWVGQATLLGSRYAHHVAFACRLQNDRTPLPGLDLQGARRADIVRRYRDTTRYEARLRGRLGAKHARGHPASDRLTTPLPRNDTNKREEVLSRSDGHRPPYRATYGATLAPTCLALLVTRPVGSPRKKGPTSSYGPPGRTPKSGEPGSDREGCHGTRCGWPPEDAKDQRTSGWPRNGLPP